MKLEQRVAVITGADSNIGQALVLDSAIPGIVNLGLFRK
jgi:NAD(P)-dependent dehydrogenase (short-subunit alcohol dehydrogenase family)